MHRRLPSTAPGWCVPYCRARCVHPYCGACRAHPCCRPLHRRRDRRERFCASSCWRAVRNSLISLQTWFLSLLSLSVQTPFQSLFLPLLFLLLWFLLLLLSFVLLLQLLLPLYVMLVVFVFFVIHNSDVLRGHRSSCIWAEPANIMHLQWCWRGQRRVPETEVPEACVGATDPWEP